MNDHKEKFNYYLLKCQFELVCNDYQDCKYLSTNMVDYKSFIPLSNILRHAIDNIKQEDHVFRYIS